MNRDQAREIYKEIEHLFPLFRRDATEESVKLWLDRLEHGEYEATKQKLKDYSFESTYPPTLAHILVREYKPRDDGMEAAIKESEEKVRQENKNPEVLEEKRRMLEEMRKKWGLANDRHQ